MEKLLALPPQQKIVLMLAGLALLAGAFYYLVLMDLSDAIAGAQSQYRSLHAEYNKLEAYQRPEKTKKLDEEEQAEQKKIEENKKLLPTEDQLPAFISGIKEDADIAGLEILKFAKGQKQTEDYYAQIPIQMKVVGTSIQLVTFLKSISGPRKRIVNVRGLSIKTTGIKEGLAAQGVVETPVQAKASGGGAIDVRLEKIRKWETEHRETFVDASFTAYAYTYTGKPAPAAKR